MLWQGAVDTQARGIPAPELDAAGMTANANRRRLRGRPVEPSRLADLARRRARAVRASRLLRGTPLLRGQVRDRPPLPPDGVAKAIPIIGGIASGGLTLASMRPMGMRLVTCLDDAKFDYTEEDLENDILEIEEIVAAEEASRKEAEDTARQSGQSAEEALEKLQSLYDGGFIEKPAFENLKAAIVSKAAE